VLILLSGDLFSFSEPILASECLDTVLATQHSTYFHLHLWHLVHKSVLVNLIFPKFQHALEEIISVFYDIRSDRVIITHFPMTYSPLPVLSKHVRQLNGLWIWHIIADQGGTFDVVKSSDSAFLFEIEAHEDSEKVLRVLSIQ
jgi:hypothetical protein